MTAQARYATGTGHLQFDPAPAIRIAEHQCRDTGWMRRTGNPAAGDLIAQAMGISSRQLMRYRKGDWMAAHTADRVAINLGLHPGMIWPEWWTT